MNDIDKLSIEVVLEEYFKIANVDFNKEPSMPTNILKAIEWAEIINTIKSRYEFLKPMDDSTLDNMLRVIIWKRKDTFVETAISWFESGNDLDVFLFG